MPEIRIVIEPGSSTMFRNQPRLNWRVETRHEKEYGWSTLSPVGGFYNMSGRAKTKEEVLEKATKHANQFCDYYMKVIRRKKFIEDNTIIQEFKCGDNFE